MSPSHIIVITTCTNRKRAVAPKSVQALSLPTASQEIVLKQWWEHVSQQPVVDKASNIYCGRAFQESRKANAEVGGSLWIISAGLGLISEDTPIPAYNLTISDSSPDSIHRKIVDKKFDAAKWWAGINAFRGTEFPLRRLIHDNPLKLFVIALSRAYAALIQKDLLSLSTDDLLRVRLIGLGIAPVLHSRLQEILMPYDERLNGSESIGKGTRSDFAQRAMRHFVTTILKKSKNCEPREHMNAVKKILSVIKAPKIPKRQRLSDEQIIESIIHLMPIGEFSSSKTLRMLRDSEKIACEQGRFARLFKVAMKRF